MVNRLPQSRKVLSILVCLVAVDLLIVSADLLTEGGVDILTSVSAVAMVGLCAMVWFGIPFGHWLLLGLIAWRSILIGKVVASSFGHGEVLRPGALLVLLVYVCSAVVLALPLARPSKRGAT